MQLDFSPNHAALVPPIMLLLVFYISTNLTRLHHLCVCVCRIPISWSERALSGSCPVSEFPSSSPSWCWPSKKQLLTFHLMCGKPPLTPFRNSTGKTYSHRCGHWMLTNECFTEVSAFVFQSGPGSERASDRSDWETPERQKHGKISTHTHEQFFHSMSITIIKLSSILLVMKMRFNRIKRSVLHWNWKKNACLLYEIVFPLNWVNLKKIIKKNIF